MAEKKKPRTVTKRHLFQELMSGVLAMRAHHEGRVTLRTHDAEPATDSRTGQQTARTGRPESRTSPLATTSKKFQNTRVQGPCPYRKLRRPRKRFGSRTVTARVHASGGRAGRCGDTTTERVEWGGRGRGAGHAARRSSW